MGKTRLKIKSPVLIVAVVFALVCVPFYFSLVSSTTHARQGCERLNTARHAQYEYLQGDLAQRQEVISQDRDNLKLLTSSHPVRNVKQAYGIRLSKPTLETSIAQAQQRIQSNRGFIDNDQQSVQALVQSTKQYATDTPVVIDCHRAYPMPFPMNLL